MKTTLAFMGAQYTVGVSWEHDPANDNVLCNAAVGFRRDGNPAGKPLVVCAQEGSIGGALRRLCFIVKQLVEAGVLVKPGKIYGGYLLWTGADAPGGLSEWVR